MTPRQRALIPALALCALALVAADAAAARAQQSDLPRRTQGPAAGPVIKLPRGADATDEQTQPPANAKDKAARSPNAEPTRWEYCVITGFNVRGKGLNGASFWAVIRYFPSKTEEVEGDDYDEALANAFAKLGDEGWELTGVRTDSTYNEGLSRRGTAYFFKRPK